MTYKLFIDDIRQPPSPDWVVVRSSEEAKATVLKYGMPTTISFDHDLGGDDTSMLFIHWLIELSMDNPALPFPRDYIIHSANPVGAKNIDGLLSSYIRHLETL